jgi:hypothetical protein
MNFGAFPQVRCSCWLGCTSNIRSKHWSNSKILGEKTYESLFLWLDELEHEFQVIWELVKLGESIHLEDELMSEEDSEVSANVLSSLLPALWQSGAIIAFFGHGARDSFCVVDQICDSDLLEILFIGLGLIFHFVKLKNRKSVSELANQFSRFLSQNCQ